MNEATPQDQPIYVQWDRPRQVGELLQDGKPRPAPWTGSGFDLPWHVLDAWTKSLATGNPCEYVIVGYGKSPDGRYWYSERLNPDYLREVLGWVEQNGRIVPLCPECERYPRHARGCSFAY